MKRLLLIVLPLLLIIGCSKPVDETSLVEKDGMMYLPNSDKPYTGEVFNNYSTGEKEYQGTYENGLLVSYSFLNKDGSLKEPINYETTLVEREGVFYTEDTNKPYNGQVFSLWKGEKYDEGTLKNGKKDGLWTGWYENGQKKSEENYKVGIEDGLNTEWYKNGQKKTEWSYKNGKGDGLWTWWYKNGQKREEKTYKDDMEDGLQTYWSENGQKRTESTYKDGKEISTTMWNYYGNGKMMFEGTYKDGRPVGLHTLWYENGQKKQEETFKNGMIPSSKEWNEDGSVKE
jgi:antitoxin component YwqK of YwqJK toxin-antitoxin module